VCVPFPQATRHRIYVGVCVVHLVLRRLFALDRTVLINERYGHRFRAMLMRMVGVVRFTTGGHAFSPSSNGVTVTGFSRVLDRVLHQSQDMGVREGIRRAFMKMPSRGLRPR
jgi:hypothetical protein